MAYNPEKLEAPNKSETKPTISRPASPSVIQKLGQTAVRGAKR